MISNRHCVTMVVDRPENSATLTNPVEWIDRHGEYLLRYAMLRVKNQTVAEDLVQETFLAALKGRDSFAGRSHERTWLVGILKNKIVDHFRKAARELPLEEPDTHAEGPDPDFQHTGPLAGAWQPDKQPQDWLIDPGDIAEQREFWKYLNQCLDELQQRTAMAFVLREIEDLPPEEICNIMEISATNLRVMLHRGRKQLRRCLEYNWLEDRSHA